MLDLLSLASGIVAGVGGSLAFILAARSKSLAVSEKMENIELEMMQLRADMQQMASAFRDQKSVYESLIQITEANQRAFIEQRSRAARRDHRAIVAQMRRELEKETSDEPAGVSSAATSAEV